MRFVQCPFCETKAEERDVTKPNQAAAGLVYLAVTCPNCRARIEGAGTGYHGAAQTLDVALNNRRGKRKEDFLVRPAPRRKKYRRSRRAEAY